MDIRIHGASSLDKFTNELLKGFDQIPEEDYLFDLFQIHAAPQSISEDLKILEEIKNYSQAKIILIHRPDELLLNPELKLAFEKNPEWKIVFLGDLALKDPFWHKRKAYIEVIPHFYTSLNTPAKSPLYTVGTFTSWGEMRQLEHYLGLVKALKALHSPMFQFMIGGTLNGRKLTAADISDPSILISEEAFVPHFNVQLYHLNGKKRLGESSGSLHSGVSIPVIFEANGMERIEEVKVVKIPADDELTQIDYASAAIEIGKIIEQQEVEKYLKHNLRQARVNTSVDFANRVISMEIP